MNQIIKTWTEDEFIESYWTKEDSSGCKWLAYDKFIAENPCEFNILVADNGTGKSWSMAESFFQGIIDGKKQIWGRIRATESQRCVQEWTAIFARHGIMVKSGAPGEKKEWVINRDGVWNYARLVLPFVYMSNIVISQPGGFEGLQEMVIDEILWNKEDGMKSAQPVFKDPIKTLLMMQDRARVSHQGEIPKTYLIANLHQPESDFFTGLQYFPNWTKLHAGESDMMIYETPLGLKVSVLILGDNLVRKAAELNWKIKNQLEREKRLGVQKYAVPDGSLQRIWEVPPDFAPLYNINWNLNSFTIGGSDEYGCYYILRKPNGEFEDLPWYSMRITDHTSKDLFVAHRDEIYALFSDLLHAKHEGDRIRYDSPFALENISKLIEQLDMLRRLDHN